MTNLMAKLVAITSVGLLVAAAAILVIGSSPGLRGGSEVTAKFDDAYPIQEGNHVRIGGAVAGEVTRIELGDDGQANVTVRLFDGTDRLRSDAIASIRQEDITGDSYLSLSPGSASSPLGDRPISSKRTLSAPRFDDLLNAFDKPVRQGLELALVQLGRTLEGRGEDVNAAALELRPGLVAANQALSEVNSQNRALKSLIGDAHRVTSQAANRSAELGRLIDSLATTLRATADRSAGLDRALERAPQSTRAARGTLARLTRVSAAGRPLAVRLNRMAPELSRSARLLGPFVDDASVILGDVDPTLGLTTKLLRASVPTLEADPKRVFTAPFDLTAGVSALLDATVGDPTVLRSLFSAKCYGGRKCDSKGDFGLGAVAVEQGNQSLFPADYDKGRSLVRAVAIPSCETFGEPIRPGCLTKVLGNLDRLIGSLGGVGAFSGSPRPSPRSGTGTPRNGRTGPRSPRRPPARSGSPPSGAAPDGPLQGTLERLAPGPRGAPDERRLNPVLDYLLGP